MEFTRAELKAQAKQQLKGNVWMLFLITLVAIILFCLTPLALGVGEIFLGYPILFGLEVCVFMNVARGQKPAMEMIFEPFKKFYWKSIGIILLQALLICAWSLLLFVPGIIKAYSYSQALYILNDNPEMSVVDCITASRKMMNGRKWDLFVLELSFILWALLGSITFGIAYIYVLPYMQLTMINFYDRIKGAAPAEPAAPVEA